MADRKKENAVVISQEMLADGIFSKAVAPSPTNSSRNDTKNVRP